MAVLELSKCFGGATPVPSPGINILAGKVLYEEGQTLVLSLCASLCASRDEYLAKRVRLETFAGRMAEALDQESVLVIASPSDSFLIEYSGGGKDQNNA